jgi:hypothetical protein
MSRDSEGLVFLRLKGSVNVLEDSMRKKTIGVVALAFLVVVVAFCATEPARVQAQRAPDPMMSPLDRYLIPDENSEVALARSAAPPSISDQAEVMVLGRDGYTTASKGGNGFVCLVQRSWAAATDFPEFWNAKILAPICLNPAAARTLVPLILMKTKLAVAAKSRAEIAEAVKSAMDNGTVPALQPGAMCYMMSKQQYLSNHDMNWHPHLMWFVPGDAAKAWGANLLGSPVLAANDPEDRMTIFLVWVRHWSDGTPAPQDKSATLAPHTMH